MRQSQQPKQYWEGDTNDFDITIWLKSRDNLLLDKGYAG